MSLVICISGILFDFHILFSGRVSVSGNVLAITDKWTTSYLTQAYNNKDLMRFIKNYDNGLTSVNHHIPHHIDVHPPGNTVFSGIIIKIVKNYLNTIKKIISLIFSRYELQQIEEVVNISSTAGSSKTPPSQIFMYSAIFIALLFLLMNIAARLLILFSTIILNKNLDNIALCSLFTWCIPAPIIFTGAYDVIYFFLTSIICFTLILWIKHRKTISLLLLGFLSGTGVLFSIGYGSVILFLITCFFVILYKETLKIKLQILIPYMLGGGFVVLISYLLGLQIIQVCFSCMNNHKAFLTVTNRSIWWIIVNYADYFIFVGSLPTILLLYFIIRGKNNTSKTDIWKIAISYLLILLFICTSGFNRGEIGRMILLFIPFNIFIACYSIKKYYTAKINYYWCMIAISSMLIQIIAIRIMLKTVVIF